MKLLQSSTLFNEESSLARLFGREKSLEELGGIFHGYPLLLLRVERLFMNANEDLPQSLNFIGQFTPVHDSCNVIANKDVVHTQNGLSSDGDFVLYAKMTTPNFETIYEDFECQMLKDAYEAITACDLWGWMKSYRPEEGKGFMFSRHANLDRIDKEMKYGGHSGSSYAWTMRVMEDIAKRGWEDHKNRVREARAEDALRNWAKEQPKKPKGNPCPCRAAQGHTSGWCGVAGGGVPGCDH